MYFPLVNQFYISGYVFVSWYILREKNHVIHVQMLWTNKPEKNVQSLLNISSTLFSEQGSSGSIRPTLNKQESSD